MGEKKRLTPRPPRRATPCGNYTLLGVRRFNNARVGMYCLTTHSLQYQVHSYNTRVTEYKYEPIQIPLPSSLLGSMPSYTLISITFQVFNFSSYTNFDFLTRCLMLGTNNNNKKLQLNVCELSGRARNENTSLQTLPEFILEVLWSL